MPTPNLPTDIDATDHAGLTADDHENYHDRLHSAINVPYPINQHYGLAAYTFVDADANEFHEFDNGANGVTVTIPNYASVPWLRGTLLGIFQRGTANLVIAKEANVNLTVPGVGTVTTITLDGELAEVSLIKRQDGVSGAADWWHVVGDILSTT